MPVSASQYVMNVCILVALDSLPTPTTRVLSSFPDFLTPSAGRENPGMTRVGLDWSRACFGFAQTFLQLPLNITEIALVLDFALLLGQTCVINSIQLNSKR